MPSQLPLPTVQQFRDAGIDAAKAVFVRADNHAGSCYDLFYGSGAILWSKEVQYVRDLFRAIYFDDADGPDLTNRIEQIWQIQRILDTYGTGFATFQRPTNAAGAETFHEGTRLRVGSAFYAVADETPIAGSALQAIVPIRATVYGPGVAVQTPFAVLDDELSNPTWGCVGLNCADGTSYERAAQYLARARLQRVNNRVGYVTQIIQACQAAGASYVAAFSATAFGQGNAPYVSPGNPQAFSAIYTGDANYTGSRALSNVITIALESVRTLGAELISGAMVPTPLAIAATVNLWDNPSQFDTQQLTNVLRGALLADFYASPTGGFQFTRDSLAADMAAVSTAIQSVTFTSPSTDLGILVGSLMQLPATLRRYQVTANQINFTFQGPSS